MPAKSDLAHLKLRHSVYWLKLSIPRHVRHLFLSRNGKERAHIEENLRTRDLDKANREKHARMHYWLREFDRRAKMAAGTLAPDIADAFRIRDRLRNADTSEERQQILANAEERAREIAGDFGEHDDEPETLAQAIEWHTLATTTTPTLHEAFDAWMKQAEHTDGTRAKYRQAFGELMQFVAREDAMPERVTRQTALAYVDWLNADARSARDSEPLSYATKKARIVALGSFWKNYLEHRQLVPQGSGIWKGHKITGKRKPQEGDDGEGPAYASADILRLLDGPDRDRADVRYSKHTLLQLFALGFYIGARLNEICERTIGDVTKIRGGYMLHIRRAKTQAGIRDLPIYHDVPCTILRAVIGKRTDQKTYLFPEFVPGGPDGKRSWNVQKALGRYRRAAGLDKRLTFHGTRNTFITRQEELETYGLAVMRYVGHKPEDITFGLYAKKTEGTLDKVARAIAYPKPIEAAWRTALGLKWPHVVRL